MGIVMSLETIGSFLLYFAASLAAPAVRQHGLVLEQGVRATFFDGYKPANYTQKWDIPRLRIPPTAVRP